MEKIFCLDKNNFVQADGPGINLSLFSRRDPGSSRKWSGNLTPSSSAIGMPSGTIQEIPQGSPMGLSPNMSPGIVQGIPQRLAKISIESTSSFGRERGSSSMNESKSKD